ncbi:MAG: hypothetical protein WCK28_00695 [Burkholderiales bacterium]
MMAALLTGTLVVDPVERTAASGRPYWTTTMQVPTGSDAMLVGVAVFSESAGERLMRLCKGSPLAAAGTMEPHEWTTRDGETRRGWRLTASEVLTVHEARRRREPAREEGDE